MGVSSFTGPSCEREVEVCNAGWGLEMWGVPCELQYLRSNSENLQVSASAEAPALEECKILSFSTVFIITPWTGDDK